MINTQNIAELSEKVAALEAAIKTAGIELPSVTTDDNGKTLQVVAGKWDKGNKIPGVVNALDSTSTTDALSAAQGKVLNDKINANTLGTGVDLSSYNADDNRYVFPNDGYLYYENNGTTYGRGRINYDMRIGDQNGTDFQKTSGGAIYVKKGMDFYVTDAFYKIMFYSIS